MVAVIAGVLGILHYQTPTSASINALTYGSNPSCNIWQRIFAQDGCGF